ncbi:TIGR00270 family protein [Candidatus Woesearchaeota archaeon]|nr:TIGR00270 family protein [Candidatus Woesearchaeota archaeon]
MMSCDMCDNKEIVSVVKIEGVEMTVCKDCSKFGTFIRPLNQTPVLKPRSHRQIKEPEVIEIVRDGTPAILKQKREQLGIDQAKLAAKMRIKLSAYNHYESGSAKPDLTTARILEQHLGVTLIKKEKVRQVELDHDDSPSMTIGDLIKKRK